MGQRPSIGNASLTKWAKVAWGIIAALCTMMLIWFIVPEELRENFILKVRASLGLNKHYIEQRLARKLIATGRFDAFVGEQPKGYHLPETWNPRTDDEAASFAKTHADRRVLYRLYSADPPSGFEIDSAFGRDLRIIKIGLPEAFLSDREQELIERRRATEIAKGFFFAGEQPKAYHLPLALAKELVESKNYTWFSEAAKHPNWWKLHRAVSHEWKFSSDESELKFLLEQLRLVTTHYPNRFLTHERGAQLLLDHELRVVGGKRFFRVHDWHRHIESSKGTLADRYLQGMERVDDFESILTVLNSGVYEQALGQTKRPWHIWKEWLPLANGSAAERDRFLRFYCSDSRRIRGSGHTGKLYLLDEEDLEILRFILLMFPELPLNATDRRQLKLSTPFVTEGGGVVRTPSDWEPWMPAETNVPTHFERLGLARKLSRLDPLGQKAVEELMRKVSQGPYSALVGPEPKAHHIWIEWARFGLQPGRERIFASWLMDAQWFRDNGYTGSIPYPNSELIGDLRLLLLIRPDLFLDSTERRITPVPRGRFQIRFVSEWERYVGLQPQRERLSFP